MIKKKLKTILILIICTLFLYSCAGLVKKRFEKELSQLAKRNINEVIEALGPPTKEYTLPNGLKMYSWVRKEGFQMYSSGGANGYPSGGVKVYSPGGVVYLSGEEGYYNYYNNTSYAVPLYCEIDLTVNSLGKIVRWTYRGNACY